jgi:hypothetical protein
VRRINGVQNNVILTNKWENKFYFVSCVLQTLWAFLYATWVTQFW